MKKENLLLGIIFVLVIFISAVSYHSVEEIHYLKSFFPNSFTVEQAKGAAILELVKVLIIFVPVLTVIFVCLNLLKRK